MLVGQTVTQAWALSEESFSEFAGYANIVSYMSTLMNGNAAYETKIVTKGVQGNDFCFVAKPIGKATQTYEQRLAIQDDFDIDHEGLFVSPLGVGSSLIFQDATLPVVSPSLEKM